MNAVLLLLLIAQAPPRFVVEPPPCPPAWLDVPALEKMIAAEPASTPRAHVVIAVPDCTSPSPQLSIKIERPGALPKLREVAVEQIPLRLRLRTLALSIAELLSERPARAEAPAATHTQQPERAVRVETPMLRRDLRKEQISIGGRMRWIGATNTMLSGARVGGSVPLGPFELQLDIDAALSQKSAAGGAVNMKTASAVLSVIAEVVDTAVQVRSGPSLELGWTWIDGRTIDDRYAGSWDAPLAIGAWNASLRRRFWERLFAEVALEAGLVLRGLEAEVDGERVVGLRGVVVGGALTVGGEL